MFRLKLLGGALIEGPAGPLSGRIAQRRRMALLACLGASRGRPVSRDKLMALLWPEADPERARHLLSEPLIPVDSRPELARAWEQAGQPDSAIAVYERYVGARALFRAEMDAFELARAYDRLAELHENRNDLARAGYYHRRLAALWRAADAQLRQRADAAMRRAVSLEGRSANRIH